MLDQEPLLMASVAVPGAGHPVDSQRAMKVVMLPVPMAERTQPASFPATLPPTTGIKGIELGLAQALGVHQTSLNC